MCAGKLPLSNAFHYNAHQKKNNNKKNKKSELNFNLTFIIKF